MYVIFPTVSRSGDVIAVCRNHEIWKNSTVSKKWFNLWIHHRRGGWFCDCFLGKQHPILQFLLCPCDKWYWSSINVKFFMDRIVQSGLKMVCFLVSFYNTYFYLSPSCWSHIFMTIFYYNHKQLKWFTQTSNSYAKVWMKVIKYNRVIK